MDWIVIAVGGIIFIAATLLSYISGMKLGKARVRTEYEDHVSLRGLSQPAREKLKGYVKIVQVWDDKRGPDRDRFKSVHYD